MSLFERTKNAHQLPALMEDLPEMTVVSDEELLQVTGAWGGHGHGGHHAGHHGHQGHHGGHHGQHEHEGHHGGHHGHNQCDRDDRRHHRCN